MRNYDDIKFVYVSLLWARASGDPFTHHPSFRCSFHPPTSPEDALAGAESQLDYRHQDKDGMHRDRDLGVSPLRLTPAGLIDSYLNGPRTLSNERLSYLVISHTPTLPTPPSTPRNNAEVSAELAAHLTCDDRVFNHELLICATHFIGDGMALHQFANDFFGLLGGGSSQEELDQLVVDEWKQRWETLPSDVRFQLHRYCSTG
jgi:hypothetical protein